MLSTEFIAVKGDIEKQEATKELKIYLEGKLDRTAMANSFKNEGSDLCKFYIKFMQNLVLTTSVCEWGVESERGREKGTYVCISRKRNTEKEMSRRILPKNVNGSRL